MEHVLKKLVGGVVGMAVFGSVALMGPAIVLADDLQITSSSILPNGTQDYFYGWIYFDATGGTGGYTWSVLSGNLVYGLDFYDWESDRGLLAGYAYQSGAYEFVVQVQDGASAIATKSFSFTIEPPVVITNEAYLPDATFGVPYSHTLQATGGNPAITWTITAGGLPSGLTLNASTGEISGIPEVDVGDYGTQYSATDSIGAIGQAMLLIHVNPQ